MRLPSPLFERGASAIPPLRPNPADDARAAGSHRRGGDDRIRQRMERKTGFEPATFSLARRCSTAEPLPLGSRSMQLWCRGRDLNSYGRCPLPPQDSVSTYSTTSACLAGAEGLEPPTSGFGDHRSTKLSYTPTRCRGAESNCRHHDFQSCALPTELPRPTATLATTRLWGITVSR